MGLTLEWPGCRSRNHSSDAEPWMSPVPVHIVTHPAQLPTSFLRPNPHQPFVIGFDCEGVDLARYGRLCVMQVWYFHRCSSFNFSVVSVLGCLLHFHFLLGTLYSWLRWIGIIADSSIKYLICSPAEFEVSGLSKLHFPIWHTYIFSHGSWHLTTPSTLWTQCWEAMHWCNLVNWAWSRPI